MGGVDDRIRDVRLQREVRLAVLLRAADDGREVLGLGSAQGVVNAHEAAPSAHIRVEVGAILHAEIPGITFIDDHHVGVPELLG